MALTPERRKYQREWKRAHYERDAVKIAERSRAYYEVNREALIAYYRTRRAAVPTEHEEQVAVINWCEALSVVDPRLGLIFAVPNGSNKSIAAAVRLKAEGLKAGVPDLLLPIVVPGYGGLFIEMKKTRGAVVKDNQREWAARLINAGYAHRFCYGAAAAKEAIMEYVSGRWEQVDTTPKPRKRRLSSETISKRAPARTRGRKKR